VACSFVADECASGFRFRASLHWRKRSSSSAAIADDD
jgi:hypothetical protein